MALPLEHAVAAFWGGMAVGCCSLGPGIGPCTMGICCSLGPGTQYHHLCRMQIHEPRTCKGMWANAHGEPIYMERKHCTQNYSSIAAASADVVFSSPLKQCNNETIAGCSTMGDVLCDSWLLCKVPTVLGTLQIGLTVVHICSGRMMSVFVGEAPRPSPMAPRPSPMVRLYTRRTLS